MKTQIILISLLQLCTFIYLSTADQPVPIPVPFSSVITAPILTVIGQDSFTSHNVAETPSGNSLTSPATIWVSGQQIYVGDTYDSRVLRYTNPGTVNATADLVIGQHNFSSSGSGTFQGISSIVLDNLNNLYVSDYVTSAVKIFRAPLVSETTSYSAVGLTSSSSFSVMTNPRQIAIDSNRQMYVADSGKNRVLRYSYNASFPNYVVGQKDFISSSCVEDSNNTCIYQPSGVALDCFGGLWVAASASSQTNPDRIYYFPSGSAKSTFALTAPIETSNDWRDIWTLNWDSPCQKLAVTTGVNNQVYILSVTFSSGTPTGVSSTTIFGGLDTQNVDGTSDSIASVYSSAWEQSGKIWVNDYYHHRVVLVDPSSPISQNRTSFSTRPSTAVQSSTTTASPSPSQDTLSPSSSFGSSMSPSPSASFIASSGGLSVSPSPAGVLTSSAQTLPSWMSYLYLLIFLI